MNDIELGRIVELDGSLYMIEAVTMTVTMQCLKSQRPALSKAHDGTEVEPVYPVFLTLTGDIDDPVFHPDRMKRLYKAEEL